jgi:hypothetical protein
MEAQVASEQLGTAAKLVSAQFREASPEPCLARRCSRRPARTTGSPRAHDAFWAAARRAHGDAGGTRALVEVLLLHRHLPHADVVTGLETALHVGASTADVAAVEARKRTRQALRRTQPTTQPTWPPSGEPVAQVVSLTERRLADPAAVIGGLPPDPRPLPSVARYDELLTLRRAGGAPPATGRVS